MKNKTLIILFVLLTNLTFSQGKSVKETIDYINSKAGKSFTVSVKKDTEMTIEIFKGGELYRTDFLILGTIDASKTTYSAEEKGIILKCLAEMPKSLRKFDGACISREFHTKGKIAYYNRSVLHIETGDKEIKGLINAFNHLINIAQDEGDYNYIENFE